MRTLLELSLIAFVNGGWVLVLWPVSMINGLARRTTPISIEVSGDAVVVRGRRIPLADITRVRDARNGNWTESNVVEDALTLYRGRRRLAKVPASAIGHAALYAALVARGVPIDVVEVTAPAYLD